MARGSRGTTTATGGTTIARGGTATARGSRATGGRHDDGDGRHNDGDGRHNDGKGQQGVRRHDNLSVFVFATETERVTQCFLPGGRRHTRGSNGKVGQSGDRWKGLFKAESFSTSN